MSCWVAQTRFNSRPMACGKRVKCVEIKRIGDRNGERHPIVQHRNHAEALGHVVGDGLR